jgi:hypothetical protein
LRLPSTASPPKSPSANAPSAYSHVTDPTLESIRELRSGDSRRILAAIKNLRKLSPSVAAQLLRLLAWNEVYDAVREVLERNANSIAGLLIDHLTNPEVQFGIRRRIPKILAHADSPMAMHGLLAGLEDSRFEVRFQCSRALDSLVLRKPELRIPPDVVFAAVERELKVAHPIWHSRHLLDAREELDKNAFLDEVLRARADQSLEHIFSLFATVLPREPIKIAFRVLHTENKTLRGLAAEYLDSILPSNIRDRLWTMVEPGLIQKRSESDTGQKALDELLHSHESLMLMIDKESSR